MYTRTVNDMLYIYRDEELFLQSFRVPGSTGKMYTADYAFKLIDHLDRGILCEVVKDRSGSLAYGSSATLEKTLKIVKIFLEQ